MRQREPDGEAVEHFLVDGVAPSVIGGGPPEPEEYDAGPGEPDVPAPVQEPPTAPIPVLNQPAVHRLPPAPEEKPRSWLGRMFRRPD
jgi:hypothetical protein